MATKTTKKTSRFQPMTTAEARAALASARPALAPCLCGCGELTKGRFFPGHDAVLKATLAVTVAKGGKAGEVAAQALAAYGW